MAWKFGVGRFQKQPPHMSGMTVIYGRPGRMSDIIDIMCGPDVEAKVVPASVKAAELAKLGGAVRHARRCSGMTQAAVAERAGIARGTLIALEAGTQSVRLETLVAVAEVLGHAIRLCPPEHKT